MARARKAICEFYGAQRRRYGEALADLGVELHTGDGGPLGPMMRFSFGPLGPDSFDSDVVILERCLRP